jgi:hypothetical protein
VKNVLRSARSKSSRVPRATLCLAVLFLLASCNRLRKTCEALGLIDPATPRPVLLDLYCDASEGSPCTASTLRETLDLALPFIARRPGSSLRLWAQGESLEETLVVGAAQSPAAHLGRARAQEAQRYQFVETARSALFSAMRPVFERRPRRRSPIVEGLTRVALAKPTEGEERFLVVISDGREVSALGDFECGSLPSREVFLARLAKRELLGAGTLRDTRVFFAYLGPTPVAGGRCPVTIERTLRIEALWRAALEHAGARRVLVSTGPPALEESAETEKEVP